MQARRIIGVKSIGKRRSVDIEVDSKEHLFYGNGIATSNSHAYSYAKTALLTAYAKYMYPLDFFCAYLEFANEKQDMHEEIEQLVSEAKTFGITVNLCDFNKFDETFKIDRKTNSIDFGLKYVKSLTGVDGDKAIAEINKLKGINKNPTWMEILVLLSKNMKSTAFKALCSIGFFQCLDKKLTRTRCLYEYGIYSKLKEGEIKWINENFEQKKWGDLISCLMDLKPAKKNGGGTSTENRRAAITSEILLLENPPYDLDVDDPSWLIDEEEKMMGVCLSIDKYNMPSQMVANCTCEEIANRGNCQGVRLSCCISRINTHTIKKEGVNKGREMCFLSVKDDTGEADNIVVFPDVREEHRFSIFEGNNILMIGDIKNNSFIVKDIREIQE